MKNELKPPTEAEIAKWRIRYGLKGTTPEERLAELLAMPMPRVKRKTKAVVTEVSEAVAKAIEANPASVRLAVEDDRGVTVIDRPRRSDIVEVLEVDAEGRPKLCRSRSVETNQYGTVEFEGGYRRSGVESVYDPIARGLEE